MRARKAKEAPSKLPPITSLVQCSPKLTLDIRIKNKSAKVPDRTKYFIVVGSFLI